MPTFLSARLPGDPAEEQKICQLAGARHAPADWILRARIIMASWSGNHVPQIAAAVGCHPKTVRLWLHRFNTDGLDGLADQPIPGRPRRITETERSQIIELARTTPPGRPVRDGAGELSAADETGPPQWTLDTLTETARARGIQIQRSQVRRILLDEKVRWRHTRSWVESPDPEFAPKGRWSSASTPSRPRAPRSSAPTNSVR
ncbi:transposase [Frankia torreyi]|uniref:Transposase n=2 Tax=Frankia TaxID=1854 RepID=A0A0D8BGX9_9ACTN|nr:MULTISPECIES: helix-turn-helix domain-containing protein [Frankia]KJE23305.1 transposase [Frankia torreyi]KQM05343.1 transposase [Frankia sp. CpI1-P]